MITAIYKNAYSRNQYKKGSLQLSFWQFSQKKIKKIATKNILIDKKKYKDLRICWQQVNKNAQPALSWINGEEKRTWRIKIFDG